MGNGELTVTGRGGGIKQCRSWDGDPPFLPPPSPGRGRSPRDSVRPLWSPRAALGSVPLGRQGSWSASQKAGEWPFSSRFQAHGQRRGGQTAAGQPGPAPPPPPASPWSPCCFCSVRGQSLLLPAPLSIPVVTPQINFQRDLGGPAHARRDPGTLPALQGQPSAADSE